MKRDWVIVRGGGDLATGTIQALQRAGFPVLVLETDRPSAIRRQVSLCEAVYDGTATVEDVTCQRCTSYDKAASLQADGIVPLLIDPIGKAIVELRPFAVIDAILAKKNLGTMRAMAPITIALGPGFTAGTDVDCVIETQRGHDLGRLIFDGPAAANTGVPGLIAGYGKERVVHSPGPGYFYGLQSIGDTVKKGAPLAILTNTPLPAGKKAELGTPGRFVPATLTGLLRGLLRSGYRVPQGFKVADIDPRQDQYANCFSVSDKARCLGGAVVTALLYLQRKKGISR